MTDPNINPPDQEIEIIVDSLLKKHYETIKELIKQ